VRILRKAGVAGATVAIGLVMQGGKAGAATAGGSFSSCIRSGVPVETCVGRHLGGWGTVNSGILGTATDGGVNTALLGTATDGGVNSGILGSASGEGAVNTAILGSASTD